MEDVEGHKQKENTMKRIGTSAAAGIAGLGVVALLATSAFAAGEHGPAKSVAPAQSTQIGQNLGGDWNNHPHHRGMMGHGMMGYGMTGPGMTGYGMMTPIIGGQGTMGPGFHSDRLDGGGLVASANLSADDVRNIFEHRLEMNGNTRLTVGEVTEIGEDKVVVEITTVDGSLVQRLEVDRHTGWMKHIE